MQTFDVFAIGATIFYPRVTQKEIAVTCPDCLGGKTWTVASPAGMSRTINCPRCHGGRDNWLFPKRYERALEITELEVTSVRLEHGKRGESDEIRTTASYATKPWVGDVNHDRVHATREAAEAAGKKLLDDANARQLADWEKELERNAARSRHDIVEALDSKANEKYTDLSGKVDALKDRLMEAISYPSLYGPKITRQKYAGDELTPANLADWLNNMLMESGLEGWSEEELHEAMCHC